MSVRPLSQLEACHEPLEPRLGALVVLILLLLQYPILYAKSHSCEVPELYPQLKA
jgi:hypothetical protein